MLWRLLAIVCLALAALGVVLPLLPTVPFLLLAAWCGGRGWPALETWLLGHPVYGPPIREWRRGGVVPRRAKWAASAAMSTSAIALQFAPLPLAARIAAPLFMLAVAIWLWRRPER
ncbi:YbaN family protein [Variovorax sp. KK3]|uniref:YbaN family protein n=1 Tax=Variovorax sp. KK3 TaxID=1855728 RepID=UPI002118B4D2|nr:YbaN family protein [Variovorax sp. KK3]